MRRNSPIDVHELLKKEIFTEDINPHLKSNFEKNKPSSDKTFGISDNYLMLDSFSKSAASNLEKGELSWNIMIQGTTNVSQNVIGSRNTLSNAIEIEFGSFTLPILKEFPYPLDTPTILNQFKNLNMDIIQNNSNGGTGETFAPSLQSIQIPAQAPPNLPAPPNPPFPPISPNPWYTNPLNQTPYGNIITIQIKEAGTQAYNDGNSSNFHHFIFQLQYDVNISPNYINAVPMFENSNLYIFTQPIIDFPSISLVFRGSDYGLFLEPDVINCNISCDFTSPLGGNYFLSFTYPNHNLLTEDRIYVKKFNSGINVLDNYINSQYGLLVGYPPDSSGISQNAPTGIPLVAPLSTFIPPPNTPPTGSTYGTPPVTNYNTFYLDPFVTFTSNFILGTINISGKLAPNGTDIIATANIIYSFGYTSVTFNIPQSPAPVFPLTINGNFSIGIFSGSYQISITGITINNSVVTIALDTAASATFATLLKMSTFCDVYIAKRRILIPTRIRTVLGQITNYITPT